MAQAHSKDRPSYYEVIDETGRVLATAPKSRILQVKTKLEKELGKKLTVRLS